jgi:hypothetical protein
VNLELHYREDPSKIGSFPRETLRSGDFLRGGGDERSADRRENLMPGEII